MTWLTIRERHHHHFFSLFFSIIKKRFCFCWDSNSQPLRVLAWSSTTELLRLLILKWLFYWICIWFGGAPKWRSRKWNRPLMVKKVTGLPIYLSIYCILSSKRHSIVDTFECYTCCKSQFCNLSWEEFSDIYQVKYLVNGRLKNAAYRSLANSANCRFLQSGIGKILCVTFAFKMYGLCKYYIVLL